MPARSATASEPRSAGALRTAIATPLARIPALQRRAAEATRAHPAMEPGASRDATLPSASSAAPARRAASHGDAPPASGTGAAPARSIADATPPPATAPATLASPLPATLEPLLDGARGAVNASSAHLRLDGGSAGEIALHLRLRGGVADVRIEGDGAQALANRSAELSRALAAEGISLRRLDADAPAPAPQAQGGASDGTSGGTSGGWSSASSGGDRGRPGDPERRDAGEHVPSNPSPAPARRSARRAGLDVEA